MATGRLKEDATPCRPGRLGRLTPLRSTWAAAALLLAAQTSAGWATSDEMAVELCRKDLVENLGAESIGSMNLERHNGVPFVYGTADFADAKGVHVRCMVNDEAVRDVWYLVKDPAFVDSTKWSRERPHGVVHHDLKLDDAAMAPPPPEDFGPHFVRPPAPTN